MMTMLGFSHDLKDKVYSIGFDSKSNLNLSQLDIVSSFLFIMDIGKLGVQISLKCLQSCEVILGLQQTSRNNYNIYQFWCGPLKNIMSDLLNSCEKFSFMLDQMNQLIPLYLFPLFCYQILHSKPCVTIRTISNC